MAMLDDVKLLLLGAGEGKDDILNLIISNTEASLKLRVERDAVPDELNHVVAEVAVRRFNRLKNEGMSSYGEEGETITFVSSDFDDYQDDIDAWLRKNAKPSSFGRATFINAYGGKHR